MGRAVREMRWVLLCVCAGLAASTTVKTCAGCCRSENGTGTREGCGGAAAVCNETVRTLFERLEEEAQLDLKLCAEGPVGTIVTCYAHRCGTEESELVWEKEVLLADQPHILDLWAETKVGNWTYHCGADGANETLIYAVDVKPKWAPVYIFFGLLGFSLTASALIILLEHLYPEGTKPTNPLPDPTKAPKDPPPKDPTSKDPTQK